MNKELCDAVSSLCRMSSAVLFDYDRTIATVPIDWKAARATMLEAFPKQRDAGVVFEGQRVDEMEVALIEDGSLSRDAVFSFRNQIESAVTGKHEPVEAVVDLLLHAPDLNDLPLFIVSNNLRATVMGGLKALGLEARFVEVYGVDTVGSPKPYTIAAALLKEQHELDVSKAFLIGDSPSTDGEFCRQLEMLFLNVTDFL